MKVEKFEYAGFLFVCFVSKNKTTKKYKLNMKTR